MLVRQRFSERPQKHLPGRSRPITTTSALGEALCLLEQEERFQRPRRERFLEDVPGEDESLLALLGDMAQGADEDGDVFSSAIVDCLPDEVQFDDPPVKALIEECGALWDAMQLGKEEKRSMRKRKLAEIWKWREHRNQQLQEGAALQERLTSAKEALTRKLQEECATEQVVRQRLREERRHRERLAASAGTALRRLETREEELEVAIEYQDAAQAALMRELQQAADCQARMQNELVTAKVELRRERQRAAEMQACFAEEQRASDEHQARLRAELRDVREHRSAFDLSAAAFSFGDALSLTAAGEALDDGRAPCGEAAADAPRAARLERLCWKQRRRLEDLREQLAQDQASGASVEANLQKLRTVPAAPRAAKAADWRESMGLDAAAKAHEVDALREELRRLATASRAAKEAERKSQEALQGELQALSALQERLQEEEEAAEGEELTLAQANKALGKLRSELQAEQEALRQEETSAERQRHMIRQQVDEQRSNLMKQRAATNQLINEARKKAGFRQKPAPGDRPPRGGADGGGPRNPRADPSPGRQQREAPPGRSGGQPAGRDTGRSPSAASSEWASEEPGSPGGSERPMADSL